MNDRFKFRGYWYNDILKEWRVFDKPEFITGDGTAEIWCDSEGGAYPELPSYADLHLCQCTGLKDKNGKLIYEGDILYENMINTVFPKGKYWIVKWDNNIAQFFIELINKTGNSLTDTWHLARHNLDYEVIGNIYENAEISED